MAGKVQATIQLPYLRGAVQPPSITDSLPVFRDAPRGGYNSDLLELARLPCLIEPRFQGSVETQQAEPTLT